MFIPIDSLKALFAQAPCLIFVPYRTGLEIGYTNMTASKRPSRVNNAGTKIDNFSIVELVCDFYLYCYRSSWYGWV